jgi:cytochrome b561
MQLKNSENHYGLIARLFHWGLALLIIAMFILGWWMVELGYYDPWRKQGPEIHKSIGILLVVLMLLRLVWRWLNPVPKDAPGLSRLESITAHGVHTLLYVLIFLIMSSGYLISTADGRAIAVFDWFSVPALISDLPAQEDIAGLIHRWLAYLMMGLVLLHAAAALKHHFINKDNTLRKMLRAKKT